MSESYKSWALTILDLFVRSRGLDMADCSVRKCCDSLSAEDLGWPDTTLSRCPKADLDYCTTFLSVLVSPIELGSAFDILATEVAFFEAKLPGFEPTFTIFCFVGDW